MSYKKQPTFFWDEEAGQATCVYRFHGEDYWENAYCHPEDKQFQSEKIGCTIAELRAHIKALTQWRDLELRPGLKALKQLHYSINTSKYYNPDDYAEKMITRQIELKQSDIDVANEQIHALKAQLKDYLRNLAKVNESLRRQRLDKNT